MAKLISLWAQVVWVLTEAMPWCIPKGGRGVPKGDAVLSGPWKRNVISLCVEKKGGIPGKGRHPRARSIFLYLWVKPTRAIHVWRIFTGVPFCESAEDNILPEITSEKLARGTMSSVLQCSPHVLESWEQGTESRGAEEQAEAQRGRTSVSPVGSAQLCLWPWMAPGKSCPNPALLLPRKTGASTQMFPFRLVRCI